MVETDINLSQKREEQEELGLSYINSLRIWILYYYNNFSTIVVADINFP